MSEEEKNTQQTATEENATSDEQVKQEAEQTTDESKGYTEEDLQKLVDDRTKELKRDISKKLGINVFDEKELDTFAEEMKNKVDKSQVEEYEKKLEEYQGYQQKYQETAFENAILKHGVNEDYRNKVQKLANVEMQEDENLTNEEAVKKVVEDFPEFSKGKRKGGMDVNSDNAGQSPNEDYLKQNYITDKHGKLRKK